MQVEVARRLLDSAREKPLRIDWGRGGSTGSFKVALERDGVDHRLFNVYTWGAGGNGVVEIPFAWFTPPFDDPGLRRELLDRLNQIPSVRLPEELIDRRPSIPLATLQPDGGLEQFLAVVQWQIAEIAKS